MLDNSIILYPDTEKELFFETDYKNIPDISNYSLHDIRILLNNLYSAAGNAFCNHSALLENALFDDIKTVKQQEKHALCQAIQSGLIIPVIYINCNKYPFIEQIMKLKKLFETRNKNTLKMFVGKRVLLAETRTGKKPIVRCSCIISDVLKVTDRKTWNSYKKQTCIKKGSIYEWTKDTRQKYLYQLTDVKPVPEFIPEGIRHGYTWLEIIGSVPGFN